MVSDGVFTLAVSGTGTGTSTGTGKNGLYDIMQNVSHYTGTGTGEITGKNTNGCYTHFQVLKIFLVMSCNWFQLQYLYFLYFFTVVCSQNGANL